MLVGVGGGGSGEKAGELFGGQFCSESARRYYLDAHWNSLGETIVMSIGWIGFAVKTFENIPYCPIKFHLDWNCNQCYLT